MGESLSQARNVFIIGLDDFHRGQLCRMRDVGRYCLHGLLPIQDVLNCAAYDIDDLVDRSIATLESFPGRVDGVTGYWDFPTTELVPLLAERFGLPGPTLEAVLKCEHKYWSRLEQQQAVPDLIPEFALVDPFAPAAEEQPPLAYPFWIKPVRSHSSFLGYRVSNRPQFRQALERIRGGIHIVGEPFNTLLRYAGASQAVEDAGGLTCIAEQLIGGRQCSMEGYVVDGQVTVFGVIDSIRGPNRTSFHRYQYPSRLPGEVQQRMIDGARRAIEQVGLDQCAFNIEFFYDPARDRVWLLEINPRISQSHSELFSLVDGAPNSQVIVQLAAGERPSMPCGEGEYAVAAKFMVRSYRDGVVTRVPSREAMEAVERCFPGTRVTVDVQVGTRLSSLPRQDGYSFELAQVYTGASDTHALLQRYHEILRMLGFPLDLAT